MHYLTGRMKLGLFVVFTATFCLRPAAGETKVIDPFEYSGTAAARSAWRPSSDSPPAGLTTRAGGGRALQVKCDLGRVGDRVYYDRTADLDLGGYGRVNLWVRTDRPGAVRGTLYFRTPGGWYAGGFPVRSRGWQQVTIERSQFREEESPSGWDSITGVRLSFWKVGSPEGSIAVAVDDIRARSLPIALLHGGSGYSDRTAELLESLGLEIMQLKPADMASDSLQLVRLAILPHNSRLPDRAVRAVCDLIDRGGKALVFYSVPDPVADRLGVEVTGWQEDDPRGRFAQIRLDTGLLDGAPRIIQQDSWNVRTARPAGAGARVAGTWVDSSGQDTGDPAVVLGPGGMFVGHVLTSGDDRAKRRFLAAAIAAVLPDWRPRVARAALKEALTVRAVGGIERCRAFLESRSAELPPDRYQRAKRLLSGAAESVERARTKLDRGEPDAFRAVLDASHRAQQDIQKAVSMGFPSWHPDFRGMWCHSAYGVSGWSWDEAARRASEMGFNALVVNMLRAGIAHYPSDVLPTSERARREGDQIAECLAACRRHGLELHVWKVNFNLSGAPESFVRRMRREGRLQADRRGNEVNWLDPSHPENVELECESMLEIVRNYDVDGIHFDYIRYPGSHANYSQGARRRFERDAGVAVRNWPGDVTSGTLASKFQDWRARQVTRVVQRVSERAREIRPGVAVSAAVFRDYPRCVETVGQDWLTWVEAGYLDFLCPMDYYSDNATFEQMVEKQLKLVGGRIPVYPGLGPSARYGPSPIQTAQQLTIARRLGAPGFMIFNYNRSLIDEVLPGLRRGILAP